MGKFIIIQFELLHSLHACMHRLIDVLHLLISECSEIANIHKPKGGEIMPSNDCISVIFKYIQVSKQNKTLWVRHIDESEALTMSYLRKTWNRQSVNDKWWVHLREPTTKSSNVKGLRDTSLAYTPLSRLSPPLRRLIVLERQQFWQTHGRATKWS